MIITIVRKPFENKSVCENITLHNTGGLNIDPCRISNVGDPTDKRGTTRSRKQVGFWSDDINEGSTGNGFNGRWPANFILSHGYPTTKIDEQSGISLSSGGRIGNAKGIFHYQGGAGWNGVHEKGQSGFGDVGGASRYFKKVKE